MTSLIRQLRDLEQKRLVNSQRHPHYPYTVWNYTAKCQYDRAWDDVTMQARGLIMDDSGAVVSRGFRKFFNLKEHVGELPTTPFKVLDKLDGSLGILYLAGAPAISTRGSFVSDQAERATAIFRKKYSDYRPPIGTTALFEIIFPENRIVVDYGRAEDLYHIGLVDNATGLAVFNLDPNWPGPRAVEFDAVAPVELALRVRPNAEGFVVRYRCGFQVKVKLEEYCRIHKSIFQTSTRSIWERLSVGETAEQIIADMPDEVMPFVREHAEKLQAEFRKILVRYQAFFSNEFNPGQARRDFAAKVVAYDNPSILFAMLDSKPVDKIIWKMVEPEWIPARSMVSEDAA